MEKTPRGTSVGVDDPYEFAGVCDHLTGEGRCRYAFDHGEHDPAFARERACEGYACSVVDPGSGSNVDSDPDPDPDPNPDPDLDWAACPHFRSRTDDRECARCGLTERRIGHSDERPLLEEHHLSYAGGRAPRNDGSNDASDGTPAHEITVYLCRWCHAKVHGSWARITDDVAPEPEAVAALEERRGREMEETSFASAAERYDDNR